MTVPYFMSIANVQVWKAICKSPVFVWCREQRSRLVEDFDTSALHTDRTEYLQQGWVLTST